MNNEATAPAPAQQTYRPALTYYHPNAKGTGCAVSLELHPAHDDVAGSIFVCFAPQRTTGGRDGTARVFPTFDWKNKICVKLDIGDLSQLLQVFRGMQEAAGEGKGLFHRSASANTIIRLEHRIEPQPGYLFEVWKKPYEGDQVRSGICLTVNEALGLSLAIEQSMGVIAFGIPAVVPRSRARPAEPELDPPQRPIVSDAL